MNHRVSPKAGVRRMRAEVLLDVINEITETKEKFRGLPLGARAIEIGPREAVPAPAGAEAGTVGRWVAVSGAAASPGRARVEAPGRAGAGTFFLIGTAAIELPTGG